MKTSTQFGKADLHIHSNYSDAKMSIEDILEYAENKTDLDIIAITDHDTIEGAKIAQKIAMKKKLRVKVIIGEEISCKEGHIIALFINNKIPAGLDVKSTLKLIKKQSGLAVVPHPLYRTRFQKKGIITIDGIGYLTLVENLENFHAIETFNSNPMLKKQNHKIKSFNNSYTFKPEIGGSDAHITEAIGIGYTSFKGKDIKCLKLAIINNKTVAFLNKWKFVTLLKVILLFMPQAFKLFYYGLFHGKAKKRSMDFEKAKIFLSSVKNDPKMKLSVVIPAHNEEEFLPACLKSLKEQEFREKFEIIVVDNNSSDKTAHIAKKYGAKVYQESKKGVSFARQKGILQAKSDIIVSTDADCTFPKDWLSNIYQSFNNDSNNMAVFGPFQYENKPKWGRLYSSLLFRAVEYFYFFRGKSFYVGASNFAYRKSAWTGVGGFNLALAQGSDEHNLLKRLGSMGHISFLKQNKVFTSSRRLKKGLIYSLFISLIGYYILDYYIFARLTGHSLFGQWPSYRNSEAPKGNWALASFYYFIIIFLSLSFVLGTGKVYAKGRVISGGKRVISATKNAYIDFKER